MQLFQNFHDDMPKQWRLKMSFCGIS